MVNLYVLYLDIDIQISLSDVLFNPIDATGDQKVQNFKNYKKSLIKTPKVKF